MLSAIVCIRATKITFRLPYLLFPCRRCSSVASGSSSISYPISAALSNAVKLSKNFCGDTWSFETGRYAPITDASCLSKQNENSVLVTVARSPALDSSLKKDFVSLQVDYKEEASAGGFIPGTYNRRDTFVTDKEILTARAIDRSLRPLLPGSFQDDLQLTCSVFSAKGDKDADVLSMNAASIALLLSSVPFQGPVGAVRVSRVDDHFVINPSFEEYARSNLNLFYACTRYKTVMIEADANEAPIPILKEALQLAHEKAREMIDFQEHFLKGKNIVEMAVPSEIKNEQLALAAKKYEGLFEEIFSPRDGHYFTKMERRKALTEVNERAVQELGFLFTNVDSQEIASYLHDVEHQVFRRLALQSIRESSCSVRRCDGRYSDEIRPLRAQVEVLPVVHGSSTFERGDTQVVGVTTIGPTERALKMQSYAGGAKENKFMVHYRFPPYCNGQVGTSYGRNRREVGHGALVEKALRFLLDSENFPYTVRVNVIATGSDGSTSMASVCAASLSLMDAGIPLRRAVAGISIGLVWNGTKVTHFTNDSVDNLFRKPENASSEYILLTDILGIEDHHGDMDFKIAGTKHGITACQLDVKVQGIPPFIVIEALQQASSAHQRILSTMDDCLGKPRLDLRPNAPRSSTLYIEPLLRSSLLGIGGYKLRSIIEETRADIQVDDNGRVDIEAPSLESYQKAVKRIYEIVGDLVPGTQFQGKITDIRDYGVMVELFQGREGLVHVSELSDKKVLRATELNLQIGQPLMVEVIAYDRKRGQVKLSHRKTKQTTKNNE
ncbi:Polyribonucleotide nucleotidyltransferase [Galdieria sulphuraria]|uniref:polyribonucleotide nucleotidyltransferase n=1 Tax=Galdieria sulphuraria TaxID=130081 RepID=M2XUQ3_GALSU|nr:polyribonucleotide nucleotidyltransferase [Galdieria sulphuraria]EME27353.1 polyribonucleotide nucleotidyltransferase [Galdieria sulphuraria]GJD09507.1 Polyribonucleotide nucleotidyltransferase [Galdieria sulphuraria]|eukprot:XP_005703873.1 polyribonucleotide nucleotidyltransferase [Galdieria sulphuraria]